MNDHEHAVSDVEYNLITTLSNLLQAEDVLHKYIADAESAGDEKVVSVFREIHDSNLAYAKRLKECLHDQFMNK